MVINKTCSIRIILYPGSASGPNKSTKRSATLTNPGQVSVATTPPCLALSSRWDCHQMPYNSTSLCSLGPRCLLALGLSPDIWLGSTSQCNSRAGFPASSPDTHSLFVGLCSGPSWCREAMTGFFPSMVWMSSSEWIACAAAVQPGPSHGMGFNFPSSSSFDPLGFYVGGVLVQPKCLNLLPEKEVQSEPLPVLRVQTADRRHNRFHGAKGHLL